MFFLKEKWLLLPIGLSLLPIILLCILVLFRLGSRSIIETTSLAAAFSFSFLILYILTQFFIDLTGVSWNGLVRGAVGIAISFLITAVSFLVTLTYAPSVGGNKSGPVLYLATPVMMSAFVSEKIIHLLSKSTSSDAELDELMQPLSNFKDFQIIDARVLLDGGVVLAIAYYPAKNWDLRYVRFLKVHTGLDPKSLMTVNTIQRHAGIEGAPWSAFERQFPELIFANPSNRDFIGLRGVTIPEIKELGIDELLEDTSTAVFIGRWDSITILLHRDDTGANENFNQWNLLGIVDRAIQFRLQVGSSLVAPGAVVSPDRKWLYIFHESLDVPIRLDPLSGKTDEQFARTLKLFFKEGSEPIDIGTALFYDDNCAIFIGHLKGEYENRAIQFCENNRELIFQSAELSSSDLPFQSGDSQLTSVTRFVDKTLFVITGRTGLNPIQLILNKDGKLDLDFMKPFSTMIENRPGRDGSRYFFLRDISADRQHLYFTSARQIWIVNLRGEALGAPREIIKAERN